MAGLWLEAEQTNVSEKRDRSIVKPINNSFENIGFEKFIILNQHPNEIVESLINSLFISPSTPTPDLLMEHKLRLHMFQYLIPITSHQR